MADRGGVGRQGSEMRTCPLIANSFIFHFMQFSAKFLQNNRLTHNLGSSCTPPLSEILDGPLSNLRSHLVQNRWCSLVKTSMEVFSGGNFHEIPINLLEMKLLLVVRSVTRANQIEMFMTHLMSLNVMYSIL